MEEKVGLFWHNFITKYTQPNYPTQVVYLDKIEKTLGIFYRALGGEQGKSVKSIDLIEFKGKRRFLYFLAGVGNQFSTARIDNDHLYLPKKIEVFPHATLNRRLYFWQVCMAVNYDSSLPWHQANLQASQIVLKQYPSLHRDYQSMLDYLLAARRHYPYKTQLLAQQEENFIHQLNAGLDLTTTIDADGLLPFPLWVYTAKNNDQVDTRSKDSDISESEANNQAKSETKSQKKARRHDDESETDGLLVFLPEALPAWEEHVNLDLSENEELDENAAFIANNMEELTLGNEAEGLSSQLKVDLDLPSAQADDYPIGAGIYLPEWHYKKQIYLDNYCLLQPLLGKEQASDVVPLHLQPLIRKLKAQLDLFLINQYKLKRQDSGEEINFDAWLEYQASPNKNQLNQNFYDSVQKNNRELSTLILADLSLSTETYVKDGVQVIDVIRDALLIFSEAIHTLGDSFALYGFSSVRNKMVRYHILKNFNERYAPGIIQRINWIKPGFYTRLGAGIRQSTKVLEKEQNPNKLLLIISDGKPNDIDRYEGRYGVEDTRKAIIEAKEKGIIPFCVTIDSHAHNYLSYLFGSKGYAIVKDSNKLPEILPTIYFNLTQ